MIRKTLAALGTISLLEMAISSSTASYSRQGLYQENQHIRDIKTIISFLKELPRPKSILRQEGNFTEHSYTFQGTGPTEAHRKVRFIFYYHTGPKRKLQLEIHNDTLHNITGLIDYFDDESNPDGNVDDAFETDAGNMFITEFNFQSKETRQELQKRYSLVVRATAGPVRDYQGSRQNGRH